MRWRVEVTFRGGYLKRIPRRYVRLENKLPVSLEIELRQWAYIFSPSFKWEPWRHERERR